MSVASKSIQTHPIRSISTHTFLEYKVAVAAGFKSGRPKDATGQEARKLLKHNASLGHHQ